MRDKGKEVTEMSGYIRRGRKIVKGLVVFSSLVLVMSIASSVATIPVPATKQKYQYFPVSTPVINADPAQSKPVGLGPVAGGGDTVSLKIGIDDISGLADIYLGIFAPSIDPNNIFILREDNNFQPLSSGPVPWKAKTKGPVDATVFSGLPVSGFPAGKYDFFLVVTPADSLPDLSLSDFYMYQTSIVNQRIINDNSDFFAEAKNIVQRLYASSSRAEVENILYEICTILGLGVYDHAGNAVIRGSGNPARGGMYLRDFEPMILADTFLRYKNDGEPALTVSTFTQSLIDTGLVTVSGGVVGMPHPLSEDDTRLVTLLYMQIYNAGGIGTNARMRGNFLSYLFEALEANDPRKQGKGSPLTVDYFDPLQAFLIRLDWLTEPLNPGSPVVHLSSPQNRSFEVAAPEDTTTRGFWGNVARAIIGGVSHLAEKVFNATDATRCGIIAGGSKVTVSGPKVVHYHHQDESPYYEYEATLLFLVDLGETATRYGWIIGVDVPAVGPVKGVRGRWELEKFVHELCPTHGNCIIGNTLYQKTDASGKIPMVFQVKQEDCFVRRTCGSTISSDVAGLGASFILQDVFAICSLPTEIFMPVEGSMNIRLEWHNPKPGY